MTVDLTGQDLRGAALNGRDLAGGVLAGVNLAGEALTGINLNGADLTGADLSHSLLIDTDLGGARPAGSRWHRAAVLSQPPAADVPETAESRSAAVAGRDPVDVIVTTAAAWGTGCVVAAPDIGVALIARGPNIEVVDARSGTSLRVIYGHIYWVDSVAVAELDGRPVVVSGGHVGLASAGPASSASSR